MLPINPSFREAKYGTWTGFSSAEMAKPSNNDPYRVPCQTQTRVLLPVPTSKATSECSIHQTNHLKVYTYMYIYLVVHVHVTIESGKEAIANR